MVDSIIKTAAAERHFVSPRQSDASPGASADPVRLRATVPYELEGQFSTLYEWGELDESGTFVRHSERVKNVYFYEVPRDKPGKYTVVLRVKSTAAVSTIVDKINVWVVWSNGKVAGKFGSPGTLQSFRTGDPTNLISGIGVIGKVPFQFDILPPEITQASSDIPNLNASMNTGANALVPGADQSHPLTGLSLANGADHKWDVSRKVAFDITNPDSVPSQYFGVDYARVLTGHTIPQGRIVDFPTVYAMGNDDNAVNDENNDPYVDNLVDPVNDHGDPMPALSHAVGSVTSYDTPGLIMLDLFPEIAGLSTVVNTNIEMKLSFREFLRLQIGSTWYEVSSPIDWSLSLKGKFTNGHCTDNGSSLTTPPITP